MTKNIPANQAIPGLYNPQTGWTGEQPADETERDTERALRIFDEKPADEAPALAPERTDRPDTIIDLSPAAEEEIPDNVGVSPTPDLAANADQIKFKTEPLIRPPSTEELREADRAGAPATPSLEQALVLNAGNTGVPKTEEVNPDEIPQPPAEKPKKGIIRQTLEILCATAASTILVLAGIQYERHTTKPKIVEKPVDKIVERQVENPKLLHYSLKVECENPETLAQLQEYFRVNTEYRKQTGKKNTHDDQYSRIHIASQIAVDGKLSTTELEQAKKELQRKIKAQGKEIPYQTTTPNGQTTLEEEIIVIFPAEETRKRIQGSLESLPTGIRMWILYKNTTGGTISPEQLQSAQEYINAAK